MCVWGFLFCLCTKLVDSGRDLLHDKGGGNHDIDCQTKLLTCCCVAVYFTVRVSNQPIQLTASDNGSCGLARLTQYIYECNSIFGGCSCSVAIFK